ncbi:MAG: signal protein [Myxococcaceae bacterium]
MTADPAHAKLHRRTFLIDREFQLKYAGLLLLAGLVISAGFAVVAWLARADAARAAQFGASSMDPLLLALLFVAVVIAAGAMGLVGLVLTHRVAGPVYVMTQYVTALAQGRFPPIRPLRRNDELKNFFERFQSALETLKAREVEEAAALRDALAALEPLGTSAQAKDALQKLSALHDRKRAAVESGSAKL